MPRTKDIPGPYRLFFYSFDCNEPRHVHVRRQRMVCKFWVESGRVRAHVGQIIEAWHEHCG